MNKPYRLNILASYLSISRKNVDKTFWANLFLFAENQLLHLKKLRK